MRSVGDQVFEIGKGVMTRTNGESSEVKYIVLWKKEEDGTWRWQLDMWNLRS
jgi:ketosteroid isomerase-like protein